MHAARGACLSFLLDSLIGFLSFTHTHTMSAYFRMNNSLICWSVTAALKVALSPGSVK